MTRGKRDDSDLLAKPIPAEYGIGVLRGSNESWTWPRFDSYALSGAARFSREPRAIFVFVNMECGSSLRTSTFDARCGRMSTSRQIACRTIERSANVTAFQTFAGRRRYAGALSERQRPEYLPARGRPSRNRGSMHEYRRAVGLHHDNEKRSANTCAIVCRVQANCPLHQDLLLCAATPLPRPAARNDARAGPIEGLLQPGTLTVQCADRSIYCG
jgi:hypothetical protein